MAKKSKEVVTESKNVCLCQFCKSHSNKPSYCKAKDMYVGRKQTACEAFKDIR